MPMRVPVAKGQIPAENLVFRDFGGLNTQAARQGVEKQQFAWLENVLPIGPGNMRALAQISAALASIPGGRVVYYHKQYNILGTSYLFAATTDGSAWQVLLSSPYTVTQIAVGGTFSGSATQIAQWKNERILIIDSGANGYQDWDGATLTNLSGTTGAPNNGTCIATYAGSAWIVNGTGDRTISYSKPDSYTDFTGTGGSTTMTDETLVSSIQQLFPANNFLYIFGTDSVNIIADVQVVAGARQFSNTNIVANIGTDLPRAIIAYYRSIWFMNRNGIFSLYGATPRKVSDELDGIFQRIDFTRPVTAGTVTIYNQLCAVFGFTYNDPAVGNRYIIAVYFDKKWSVASQSTTVAGIATNHGARDTLIGTNGADVHSLFDDTVAAISQTVKSRFWDFDDYISIKESLNLGVEMTLEGLGTITPTLDSERQSVSPIVAFSGSTEFLWYNSNGVLFTWFNSLGAVFHWLISGYVWLQGDVENQGHYLGFTITSETPQNVFQGFQINYRKLPVGWGM